MVDITAKIAFGTFSFMSVGRTFSQYKEPFVNR